jgi:hypothetical protein
MPNNLNKMIKMIQKEKNIRINKNFYFQNYKYRKFIDS